MTKDGGRKFTKEAARKMRSLARNDYSTTVFEAIAVRGTYQMTFPGGQG